MAALDSVWCNLHVDLSTRPINHGSTRQVSAAYCPANIQTVLWFINPTIFNVAESMGRLPHWLNIGCSKHYFFNNFLKNSLSNYFQFILFYFVYNWTKIKSKMSEYPKSKPTTHCFIFNLSELYLDHQTLGWWDDRPSNPVYLLYWRLSDFK